ncbi:Long-chain-fatty-acid--CoA ligase [Caldibacillus thermoamylovorans]|uniref:non-ribosomal peptide synthetase n=1 Tax=Caldibacillus thermoamylovorans TaxID=35841 RepID=UPI0005B739A1|nr:non-ribosomal peptide synthetase [Caldibacillus thermoamylovorans]KIO65387.1 Long-chain-fatty-acid--CoA ligase [Caldibacillus thermoamylovorans]
MNRPELTAERFIPHPFKQESGEKLYRTGDLVRYLPDGKIEFIGRADHQVKIRGFRIELGEIEVVLKQYPDVRDAVTTVFEAKPGDKRLAAYIVGDDEINLISVRNFMKEKLPRYMVPAYISVLPSFPLTSNGKVNRKALPSPIVDRKNEDIVMPRNERERKLLEIWKSVLNQENIGVNDNFFELGGDSILSIQIVSRAKKEGINITPSQMFVHQTIIELAQVSEETKVAKHDERVVTGELPLTPIQSWFFSQNHTNPHHWNQSMILVTRKSLDEALLKQTFFALEKHHDALRLRYEYADSGQVIQYITEPDKEPPFTYYDISMEDSKQQEQIIKDVEYKAQRNIDIYNGPLWNAVYLKQSKTKGHLIWVVHHLAIDGVSWRILIEDFQNVYTQLENGEKVNLPAKTTSFKEWSNQLTNYSTASAIDQVKPYWLDLMEENVDRLPIDNPKGENLERTVEKVIVSLNASETKALLKDVPKAFRTQIDDVLLTALTLTISEWCGQDSLWINLEGHGREDIIDGVDLSRTVGWFTSLYPVHLKAHQGLESTLKQVKETLRGIPNKGIDYGILRYINEETSEILSNGFEPEISFNYLGQFKNDSISGLISDVLPFSEGSYDLGARRAHLLEVVGIIINDELSISFNYSNEQYFNSTIQKVANSFLNNLKELIEYCSASEVIGYTPSDFPLVNLSQQQLDNLMESKNKKIKTIYPLSPLQEGMTFHTLLNNESGDYVTQWIATMEGELNENYFEEAWQKVLNQHDALRTGITQEKDGSLYQIVYSDVHLPITFIDWSELSISDQHDEFEQLLEKDRISGFDLDNPPLMRLMLIKLAENQYRFIWTSHHVILDGWSLNLILRDVFSYYESKVNGTTYQFEYTPQYQTYIDWLSKQDQIKAKEYWKNKLSGFTEPTPLGMECSEVQPETGYGEQISYIPKDLTTSIQSFARKNKLTPNTLFQAAWAMLLSCYSGEDDVVFGVTSSGRPTDLQYAEKTVGMFINTLPARIKLSQDTKVVDWLRELQQQQIEALQFEYSSLVDIQGWGDLLPGQPLFKSLFVYENYPIEKYSMSNIRVHDIRGIEQLGYPLGISITPDECFEIKVLFDKEKFNFDKINLIISQFMGILREFIEKRNSDLSLIQVLTKDEQDQVLKKWNETQQPMPSNKTIFELFEEKVEETPDAIAINCDNELVTYRELNERANQVANYLIAEGVGVEDRVGLSVKRSVEMIVGILGIMKAGGCYVPLDPNYPLERLDYMIKDADISLIITQEHIGIVEKFPEVKKLYIDRDADKLTQYSSSNIVGRVSEENLAYIIYTSGSTGRPKGVMIEHRNVVNVIKYEIEMFDIHPDSRVYQFTSLNFDVSVSEIMTTLVGGATLYLNKGDSLYGYELIDYIKKHHVTLVTLPISVLASLPYEDLDDLETIVVGGDTCPQHLVKLWGRGRKFINCYGPTEAAICSTMYFCDAESESAPPIGRPVANTSLYILDHYQRPVPIGVAGELYIGGAGVGRGYINQDDLTSESFIPDPFNPQHGKLMYKTGDLVRYLPDGNIEFVSRIDNQVKVRGFRIELGEIESVLLNHSEVKDCVVIVREDSLGEKQLVAYVITVNGNGNKQEIRDYLLEQLPEYMIPAYIIEMTEFPLTPNGKIDKKALPIPQHTVKEEVAPKTSIEELVTIIWSDVLGVDEIGSTDSFFEIGGHSLLATAAVSRLREAFGVDLSLRTLFEYTTVKELSMEIEKLLAGENHNKLPELKKVPRDEIIPLSYAQQRLWFFDKLTPQSALYNIPLGIKINGALQIEALERSVNRLIARHETLRTTIQEIDGKASQVIAPIQECVIEVEDFSSLTEEIKYERARSYAEMVANQPFNLQEGPLLRVHLMKLAEKEYIVLFTMHHIISDGWSMEIFVEELFAFYQEEIGEENADLSPLAIQYSDYAVWQREWLEDGLLEKQLMYWKEELTGKLPVLDLPTDYTRPPVQTYNGTVFAFEISESLKNKLEKLSKQQETTMFMTLLAAYQGFLARYTGQDDIIVGSPIANRNHPDIDGLIGFFVNTLPFRLKLTDEMNFNDILSEVRNKALNAYINQDIPFEKLVDEIQPERNLSYSPIYQTMFVYQKDLSLKDKCFGLDLTEWEVSQHLSNFDITLRINEQGKGLKATFEYNTDLFKEETIERLSRHFNHWLTNIVESPEKPVVYIPVIDGKEQQIILKDWNDNTIPLPNYEMINHWFEEQVLENPENAAIVSKFEKITYRELNQYSNRLAHYLLSRADSTAIDRIGICMNRSIDMIVAMLAVVKAGAAYVPIYPSYPADRIKYMVENSDISIIFSQSGLQQKTESLPSEIVFLDELKKDLSQYSTENIRLHDKNGENLTYVIYTSGSTGKPKGVMVTHRSLINLVNWHRTTYELSSQDRTSHIAGIAFDAAVWEIWPALCSGSALYLPEDEERLDPLKLQDWLVKNKISISFLPTPLAEKVIQLDWPKNVHLRALLTGGDKLHSFPSEDLPFSLYNHYGPTENTVVTTACLIEPKDSTQAPPIGYPIDNTEVYVLDQYMQPVPIGVVGELYIGGLSLAKGYLNQPELTNERFIRHPFNSSPGARLYKTGDLVRYLPNRCLEFVGRSDDQVQIRGYRIELGEIESTLINYEGVEDVVVITRELNHDVKQLVAYVMTKEELNIHEIREYLKEKLPSYMVPAYILTLDEFPLTPNGKVDREKLPEPKIEKDTGGYVAPRNDRERKLVEIWQQVLNQSNIGIYDNFFECGGDSILSIQVVSRASQAGIQITPKQIFEYQTVVELANVAKEMPKAHAEQCIVTGDVPLAPIQSWFFEQRYPNPHYWNQSMALSTARSLDIDLLRKSLHELSKHHDVLRLRYKSSESGEWKQYITADVVIDLEVYDVSELDGVEYHSFINKKESIAQSSLDIENGPIWKAVYFQNNSGKGRLFLVVHHLAIDGVSWRILIEDLETVYKQLESGQQISLPAKTTSYKEWVAELIRYSSSTEIDGAKEYWLDALQTESDSLPIKVNHTHSGISEKITVSLNATETKALLTKVTANYRAQIDEILLTALTKALTNSLEVENIWINLEGHGREEVVQNIDITRTIGWFTSMYPVLLSNEKDLAETLKYVKQILHRIPNKGVDYGILKYLNKDVAQKMKNQQVEPVISFNYLGQFNQSDSNALLLSYDTPTTSANVDPSAGQPHLLDIVGMVQDDELILQWSCDYELFDVFNIKNAASEMVIHLKAFITNDVSQTSAYAVTDFPDADLTDEELARLLNDDN